MTSKRSKKLFDYTSNQEMLGALPIEAVEKIRATRPPDWKSFQTARIGKNAELEWNKHYLVYLNGWKRLVEESPSPPPSFEFLLFLLPIRQRDHVIGDLEEEFRSVTVPKYGRRLASILYAWQVLIEITRGVIAGVRGVAFGWIFAKLSK